MRKQHHTPRWLLSLFAMPALALSQVSAQNLVVNGDFSLGNTGFSSAYNNSMNLVSEGTYAIGANPASFHYSTYTFGDHTTGAGLMMIVNPSSAPNQIAWQETLNVTPNTVYDLSAWAVGWYPYDSSPANLRFQINNTPVGTDLRLQVPSTSWVQFSGNWNSGAATSATIQIIDLNTALSGNDFSLDDISLQAVPEPSTVALMLGGSILLLAPFGVRMGRGRLGIIKRVSHSKVCGFAFERGQPVDLPQEGLVSGRRWHVRGCRLRARGGGHAGRRR
jgi:hypothetical protein